MSMDELEPAPTLLTAISSWQHGGATAIASKVLRHIAAILPRTLGSNRGMTIHTAMLAPWSSVSSFRNIWRTRCARLPF